MALQLIDESNKELFFFFGNFKTNELIFRNGQNRSCSASKVPELFKLDLVNYTNLWEYLFFLKSESHWRFDWPVGKSPLDGIFSEMEYFGASGGSIGGFVMFWLIFRGTG